MSENIKPINVDETKLERLAKAIFRTPYGFLIIVLCIANYYQFQVNERCQEELRVSNAEHIQDLKNIKSGLEKISDTTTTYEIK